MDDTIRELKKISGFSAYLILNNDGKSDLHMCGNNDDADDELLLYAYLSL